MTEYRISKYDPDFFKNDRYLKNDWTDFSDIGRSFDGRILTAEEYFSVEDNYVRCIVEILKKANVEFVYVDGLETYEKTLWENGQRIAVDALPDIIRDCLRNKCWCRLAQDRAFVHFGYDFYIYMGVDLSHETVKNICQNCALFCSEQISPYHLQ